MVTVNVENFVRAETARMFDGMNDMSSRTSEWHHNRTPTPLDQQNVIRMNRDTLYSSAIVDISAGASLTMPDAGARYQSVMVVNENHYVNDVLHGPGRFELSEERHGSSFVMLLGRTLIDASNPDDVAEANRLQDQLLVESNSRRPWSHDEYDQASHDEVRGAILTLAGGLPDADRTFGSRDEVDPIRHLLGTAYGWGGLPTTEAFYYVEPEPHPIGRYTITLRDVPVDAFWSVTIYNRDGFLEPNEYNSFNINSVVADAADDGSVVLELGPEPRGGPNYLYLMDGWNYALRLYRPRPEVLDRSWTPPKPVAVT